HPAHPAELDQAGADPGHDRDRRGDRRGGLAQLPRPGRGAAQPGVGRHAVGRTQLHLQRTVAGDRAGRDADPDRRLDHRRRPRAAPARRGKARPMTSTPAVEIRNLSVAFGPRHRSRAVVRDLSLTVRPGEALALVGESGSGKSVTARTLVGLTGPGARVEVETLRFGGEDLTRYTGRDWRRLRGGRIGFVLQDALASLDGLRTVGREIAEPLALHTDLIKPQREQQVISLLASVGVPEPEIRAKQYPHQLSGGLRQRALIASAIAAGPEFLIADEPTTALDTTVQRQIIDLFGALKAEGTSMLVVSHDLAVVAQLADRIAVMKDGEIVETGPTRTVLSAPEHPYTRALLAAVPSARTRGSRLSAPVDEGTRAAAPVARRQPDPDGRLIEVRDVIKTFPGPDGKRRTAVGGVSFVLRPGETLGLVGESGSGKTTAARL